MGVDMTHYVVLGVKVPFKDIGTEKWDMLEAYEDNGYEKIPTIKDGLTLVSDGMNGEYAVMGMVLAKGMEEDGLEMTECRCDEALATVIGHKVCQVLGVPDRPASIFAFTHFH